jgi:hypothetical protein
MLRLYPWWYPSGTAEADRLFLEERPTKKINVVLLRAVNTCTYARPPMSATTQLMLNAVLNHQLRPLAAAISRISDKQERNAVVLELMDSLAKLGDYSDREGLIEWTDARW